MEEPSDTTTQSISKLIGLALLTAILYFLTGFGCQLLTVPPSYASAIWAPSGIALGAMLLWGPSMLPGIFIGSCAINLYIAHGALNLGLFNQHTLITAGAITLGSMLQAYGGYWLVKRLIGLNNTLEEQKDIFLFILITGPLACLINATWSSTFLLMLGTISHENFLINWYAWWAGDTIGVLVFTPLYLIFAKPEPVWQERRLSIALPLILSFLVVLALDIITINAEIQRIQTAFTQVSRNQIDKLQDNLDKALISTRSLQAFIEASNNVSPNEFSTFSKPLLDHETYLQALEWAPHITDPIAFDIAAKKAGYLNLQLTEFTENGIRPAGNRAHYFPILHIAPFISGNKAHGFDLYSHPIRRAAIQNAIRNKSLVMTPPIKLAHGNLAITGILIFAPTIKQNQLTGFAAGVINMKKLLENSLPHSNLYRISIIDITTNKTINETTPVDLKTLSRFTPSYTERIKITNEVWQFQSIATSHYLNKIFSWKNWGFIAVGLLFCGLINIILFIVQSQTNIIRRTVDKKTRKLNEEQSKNLLLLNSTSEGSYGIDIHGQVTFMNLAASKMLDIHSTMMIGQPIHKFIKHILLNNSICNSKECSLHNAPFDKQQHKNSLDKIERADGKQFHIEYTANPLLVDQQVIGAVVVFKDITERIQNEDALNHLTSFDILTNLPNRQRFLSHLKTAVITAQKRQKKLAVCIIDIDNFKQINDAFGQTIADKFLIEMSRRFILLLNQDSYIARMEGDEFGLILENIDSITETINAINKYQQAIKSPIKIMQREIWVSISIGIAEFPAGGNSQQELMRNAYIAMHRVKQSGKNNYAFFNTKMDALVKRYNALSTSMIAAIENNEFNLHYQPIVDVNTNRIIGAEALIGWESTCFGKINPDEFIPIAEENGQIILLGEWILRTTFKDYKHLSKNNQKFQLSINISVQQLQAKKFHDTIKHLLRQFELDPSNIVFEVTETTLIKNFKTKHFNIKKIRKSGIRFALDDFGSGHSSFKYLKELSVSIIKVDQSFMKHVPDNKNDTAIVKSIIRLAHSLGYKTIIEGIEQPKQLDFIKRHQAEYYQGYYFSKAMSLGDFIELQNKQSSA